MLKSNLNVTQRSKIVLRYTGIKNVILFLNLNKDYTSVCWISKKLCEEKYEHPIQYDGNHNTYGAFRLQILNPIRRKC